MVHPIYPKTRNYKPGAVSDVSVGQYSRGRRTSAPQPKETRKGESRTPRARCHDQPRAIMHPSRSQITRDPRIPVRPAALVPAHRPDSRRRATVVARAHSAPQDAVPYVLPDDACS